MRIHIRIAMPGEMLANGKYAPAFEPTAVCHHLFRHPLRVLAKGAYVYHRVQRIRIDIRIGCKIDVYPNSRNWRATSRPYSSIRPLSSIHPKAALRG